MTTNPSICFPTVPLLLHSNNNINKIHSLSFPLSGFNNNASGRENTRPFRFQCRCTNEENCRQIKTFGTIRDGISNLTFKWMSVVSFPILELFLLKREPQNVSFDELMGADDIIKQFRQVKVPDQLLLIFAKLFSSSKKTEPENVSLDQLIGMDTAISQMRKILKRLQGSAEYDRMNVKVPSGILIHGPSRTGKSSLVHAFAREAKLPFFAVQGKEIEKNPPMILSLFAEARVNSPSIIYIEGIEVITSTGVFQILDQMESCENDGAAIVVIGTVDNVKTLLKDIKDGFDMLVHLGKPDMVSRSKMVDGLMKDYVVLEDRDKICNYIASETSGMVWKNIKAICNECCAHVIVERETAIGVCSWVTFQDVTKTLKDTKYRISMLEEKDATGKEDGTIVVSSCIALMVASTSSFGYNHDFNSTSAHWASLLCFVNLDVLMFLIMQGTNRQLTILFYKTNIKTVVNRSGIRSKK